MDCTFLIEPLTNENDSKSAELTFGNTKLKTKDNDLILVAREKNKVVGYIELRPLPKNCILIKSFNCGENTIGRALINEALKYAWELSFTVALTKIPNKWFVDIGFEKFIAEDLGFANNYSTIFAFSLSYNGIDAIRKEFNHQLN